MAKSIKALFIRRILLAVPVLFGVTGLVFLFVALAPQSAAVNRLNSVDAEAVQKLEAELGLNQPLHVRYIDWVTGILHGDFGTSLINDQAVFPLLVDRMTVSAELAIFGFLWMVVLSSILGLISAFNRNHIPDHIARTYAILGISIPDFVVGILLIMVFGVWLGWLPAGGWTPLSESIAGNLKRIILPSYTVGFLFTAIVMRMFRSDLLETMNKEHVNAAKAMGIPKQRIVLQDIVKPAVIPTITTVGMTLSLLIAGLVLAEIVFAIPGIGRLTVNAIFDGDFPIIQGALLIIATVFVLLNLVVDLAYYYLDPRIRVMEK